MKPFGKYLNYINDLSIYLYPYIDIIGGFFFLAGFFFIIFSIYKDYSFKFVKNEFLLFNLYLTIILNSLYIIIILFNNSRSIFLFLFTTIYPRLDLIFAIAYLIIGFFLLRERNTRFSFLLEYFLLLSFIFSIILFIYLFYYLLY